MAASDIRWAPSSHVDAYSKASGALSCTAPTKSLP
jgi:hypothetical protein